MTDEEAKLIELFQLRVDKRSHDECWEWLGELDLHGFGQFREERLTIEASVLAWLIFFGDIPEDKQVWHRCNSPTCVNPYHLYLEDKEIVVAFEPKPLPTSFTSLKPGTEDWGEFWKAHPEMQEEMLEFRKHQPFAQNINIEESCHYVNQDV